MERGHVKLWRKSIDSGLLQNPDLWTFWSWCLMKASWKEYKTMINYQVIDLLPGQFIFGRQAASKELKMSERTIRTCVQKLKNMKNMTIKTTNKYSIISIINWDIYQDKRPADDQQNDQQATSRRPAGDHKQEVKEVKEGKELKQSDVNTSLVIKTIDDDNCPHTEIIKIFHETLPELPRIKKWSGTCQQNLKSRWREDKDRQNLGWWKGFFEYISGSDFLMGRKKEWQADLIWIVRPTNFNKIINGSYSNRGPSTGSIRTDSNIITTLSWAERKKRELENGYK